MRPDRITIGADAKSQVFRKDRTEVLQICKIYNSVAFGGMDQYDYTGFVASCSGGESDGIRRKGTSAEISKAAMEKFEAALSDTK